MTAPDPRLGEIEARHAAVESKTVHNAVFGDILRTGWCTYYFGADNHWHNARTGQVVEDLEALEDERLAEDEVSEWLTPNAPADVAYLLAELRKARDKLAAVSVLAETWRYKGEFGWGSWQEGHGPDQEGYVLDQASSALRAAVAAATGGGDRG